MEGKTREPYSSGLERCHPPECYTSATLHEAIPLHLRKARVIVGVQTQLNRELLLYHPRHSFVI